MTMIIGSAMKHFGHPQGTWVSKWPKCYKYLKADPSSLMYLRAKLGLKSNGLSEHSCSHSHMAQCFLDKSHSTLMASCAAFLWYTVLTQKTGFFKKPVFLINSCACTCWLILGLIIVRKEYQLLPILFREWSRKIKVFKVRKNERQGLENLRRIIKVERRGSRGDKTYEETAYYISSLTESAQVFAKIIRGHWKIENQLHWVKDVNKVDRWALQIRTSEEMQIGTSKEKSTSEEKSEQKMSG